MLVSHHKVYMNSLGLFHNQHLKNEKKQSVYCVFNRVSRMLLCLRPYSDVTLNFLYKVKTGQYILKMIYLT
jgi:hypothetical protein